MELKHVEASKIVALMTVKPKQGQPFLPDVIAAVAGKYRFQKYPSTFEEMTTDPKTFRLGVWEDCQIEELAAYNDGLIITAGATTDVLEGFLADVLGLMASEFGVERNPMPTDATHFESALVVKMDPRIISKFAFLDVINSDLAAFQESYGIGSFEFQAASIETAVDAASPIRGRRPTSFSLIRRVSVPFNENMWFSQAPLKTADHLALLENLETIMRR